MKYILIISDGMADMAVEALNGKTPMEVAVKPNMDALAVAGTVGTALTCPDGLPAGSDTAILTIFGCEPRKTYFGRAPLEAAAQGVTVPPGAMAFRANMACVKENKMVSHSAGGIDGESSRTLIEDLIANPEFATALKRAGITVYPTDSYRHICVWDAPEASAPVQMFAPHDNLGVEVAQIYPKGKHTQTLIALMELSQKLLSKHPLNIAREKEGKLPANSLWFWANGTSAALPSFYERYKKTGAVISAVPLVQGIGVLQGLDVIRVDGATGELDTNYEGKAAAALDALKSHDFVCVHIEAPDECTHNGDLPGKIKAIENVDARVLRPILDGLRDIAEPYRILIMSDHYTLISNGKHDATPVPYLLASLASSEFRVQSSESPFSERLCAGGTHIADGNDIMSRLFE